MVEEFAGEWIDSVFENMDEYLKEVGIGFLIRKLAKTIKDKCIMKIEGDKVTLITESTFKNHTISWVMNEKTLINTIDGRKHYSIFTYENGKMIENQFPYNKGDKISTITRHIENGKLVITMECNGVKAIATYTRA
ncbi:Cytosolic fatty-acid binding domain and Calycin-like domain and Calycin domain-containing protein [Strongyloides ratti]|uniref:Cytosolic fatty-acid binding domain and Calycin-like domain and Calycin domain-containing protein n=1 Tax=Strongyloides ratti TaxID=34506 RepID=A0A090LI92_STRRB|nr:Cytosolic fatty-acid binding domain and Calycin-like domain and Calycin domain-containing protein [Strongyloides ratti]CEF69472.1 Cytosolic fatty-acid binding domain and Calycin-like domain and Calycin domain-containing protein [Strongyloides ratti]